MRKAYLTALIATLIIFSFSIPARSQSNPHKYIMDSLNPYASVEVKRRRYKAIKEKLHAEGVTIDMWWGIVEPEEGNFKWDIYKENFKLAREAGLKIIPIKSDHFGPDFPLPRWVWNKGQDMKFKDSDGIENEEFISYFAPEGHELRKNVLKSFKANFQEFDPDIPKIYIGLGPSGEARFPSLNYPGVGRHQAGSDFAKLSFQNFVRERYKNNIEKLNYEWGINAVSFEAIDTPTDGLRFFEHGVNMTYGRDFLEWYQGVLETSINQDQQDANEVLKTGENSFHGILAGKIAGLYWLATDKVFSHGAERAAGYNDYRSIIKVFKKNNFGLTFTCFEMDNKDYYPHFSRAKDLVNEVAQIAEEEGVELSGENAEGFNLQYKSWDDIRHAYNNINEIINHNKISAFTTLRADDLIDDDGNLKPEGHLYLEHMDRPVIVKVEEEMTSHSSPLDVCAQKLGGLGNPSAVFHH